MLLREDAIKEFPLPADFEEALDEVVQLRRLLWKERQWLSSAVEELEMLRRENKKLRIQIVGKP